MVVDCEHVWREVSNYLEGDVSPELRAAMEEHLRGCKHCTAVLDGTRNVMKIYGDERMFEMPLGFSQRLRRRVEEQTMGKKGTKLGWMVAFALAAMLLIGFEVGDSAAFTRPQLLSEHARAGRHVPADILVIVSADGKIFHAAGCPFIHDKAHLRTMPAAEAERAGYAPCVRCMKKYLTANVTGGPGDGTVQASLDDSDEVDADER
jgi:Putative zinc-finger